MDRAAENPIDRLLRRTLVRSENNQAFIKAYCKLQNRKNASLLEEYRL